MQQVTIEDIQKLHRIESGSHKGQNGRLLLIGGSELFHAASLWSLTVASRIVDLVHYCSTDENNEIVLRAKEEFRNGIVIPRNDIRSYIEEDDAILIGPGMTRDDETRTLTNTLLKEYPHKQWVIDAGALQMVDVENIPQRAILTPHQGEFESLLSRANGMLTEVGNENLNPPSISISSSPSDQTIKEREVGSNFIPSPSVSSQLREVSTRLHCIILFKGQIDVACNEKGEMRIIRGGNAGMTKGGTGDVLAGLIAALACTNDPFLSTISGSFINKAAGDELYTTVGPYFNASDLADQIPRAMHQIMTNYELR